MSEILDRRIGRDELSVIEVCRTYVVAQREFVSISAEVRPDISAQSRPGLAVE